MAIVATLVLLNGRWALRNCEQLRPPRAGAASPVFSLPTPAGQRVALSDLRGKVVLLDFWASWCTVCMRKMPDIEKLQAELGPRGLTVLAINVEGDAKIVEQVAKRRGSKLTMLVDDGSAAASYGVQSLPHLVIVDRHGRLVHVQTGGGRQGTLRRAVLAALQAPGPQS